MRKLITSLFATFFALSLFGQNGAGLLISEILPNPAGTDSPFEFVELVATRTINFASTPYTVVACNNGTGSASGWIAGANLSYAFEITSGIVNAGDVVYVGGSSMAPTGTILRAINTGTTNGDGFGAFNTGGVVGNGGTNADGIGVFALPVASITNSSVPVDAIFYGTTIGTALVNGGLDGYQLPINDLYPGGKLQSTSYLAPDAASAQVIQAAGTFNPSAGSFTTGRSFTLVGAHTNAVTAINLSTTTPAATLAFATTNQTVLENVGTVNVTFNVSNPNNGQVVVQVSALPFSTGISPADYTISPSTFVIPANTSGPQTVTVTIVDDVVAERDEYLALAFTTQYNGTFTAGAAHFLYIKDNDLAAPVANNEVSLSLLTSYSNGVSGTNSAEIVVHDSSSQRLFIANSIGGKLDILNFTNAAAPTPFASISMAPYGNINSVAVFNGMVAVAIENATNPQDSGKIVFFNNSGIYVNQVKVGAMPDMLTFNHAGTKVITACEGEPNAAYTSDPNGSVCVVDISGGVVGLTQSNVSFINFTSYNGQEALLRAQGIRIYGPGATAAQDFEPEYVTISDDDLTAWVVLQENNALAKISLTTNTVTQLMPLGFKNHATGANAMDASDVTAGINLSNFPVNGMYLPDAIYQYTISGTPYLITANEGDARAYTGFDEESNFSGLNLDPVAFPYAAYMKSNFFLGKLKTTNKLGDIDNDGDIDQVYSYGARSFSIWNGTSGAQVYDSGDDLERITSTHPVYSAMFNASNGGSATPKNRSDDKGPEPEGVATAQIDGEWYAFIALERIGGSMVYNVTNPAAPYYVGYNNNRSFALNGPDRGAEGVIYISAAASPNGNPLLILANEVSSTLSIFQVSTCAALTGVSVTPNPSATICGVGSTTLTATSVSNTNYQWYLNNSPILGANSNALTVSAAGDYSLEIVSSANSCTDRLPAVAVTVVPVPTVTATASASAVCNGSPVTLNGGGASTYTWTGGVINNLAFVPGATASYAVTGTDTNGCVDTAMVTVVVNTLPTVGANTTASSVCAGANVTLNGSGASTYTWTGGVTNNVQFVPSASASYTVTGTDANGCVDTATVSVTVNSLPTVSGNSSANNICAGTNVTLNGSGASTYTWTGGVTNNVAFPANVTTTYIVTGTDGNGCTDTAAVTVTVNPLPTVVANSSASSVCAGSIVTLNGGGASTYAWTNGITNNVSFVPVATATYTVTGTDGNGCANTASVTVTVNTLPTVTFPAFTTDTICLNAPSVVLTGGTPTGGTYSGPGVNAGSFDPSVAGVGVHQLGYSFSDGNGCTDSASVSVIVDVCTGIDAMANEQVTVYPNPSSGLFQVKAATTIESLEVYDAAGRFVLRLSNQGKESQLDLSQQAAGFYQVRIQTSEGLAFLRVQKL